MSAELIWVLALLGFTVVLFVSDRVRMDVIALLAIVALAASGTLSVEEALAGFSDPSVVLIAAMFVIGEGLVRSGIAHRLGGLLVRGAGQSETRLLILLMPCVVLLGAVMSSTGVVAIFVPVVLSVAARIKTAPSRLMMPLSFAGLISGMTTLVATAPNLVVNSELQRAGLDGFGFFSITPLGVVVLLVGVGYMLVARRWLAGDGGLVAGPLGNRSTLNQLIQRYRLSGRAWRLRLRSDSPMIGRPLDTLALRERFGINAIGIERKRRLRRVIVAVFPGLELRERDTLLVDAADEDHVRAFCTECGLEPRILRGDYFSDRVEEIGMAEITPLPDSEKLGRSLRELAFRSTTGLSVVSIQRNGEVLVGSLIDEPIRNGDVLLVAGEWRRISRLQRDSRDFVVFGLPAEIDDVAPSRRKAPLALLSLALTIALMVSNAVPNAIAALIGCLLMAASRCIDAQSAYRSIHWPSLILIVGMMPFAIALQKTGGVALMVELLVETVGGLGPRTILAGLFALTAVIGLFISNTATAVLMAPIAIALAERLDASPYPFAMIVTLAASAAFMTPVSSPVNTLVVAPGGYRFVDFVKIGVPFTLIVMAIGVALVPWLFPF
ncbi:SLC13 family permease [Halotalea alkalilenta]|uniref:Citrate transporter n=1 Tax=Halotalea alkalilenta TaxID=376489 RepID=A0A172YIW6_9GAMM|nr:SLC13 family permease [Halotalea alkalilenta]ANF59153.1 citrate transporter [Halotalea alkalilenta]